MTRSGKILDSVDRRLLALLRANARQPLVALAKALGLSRSATQERLRRLERSGVIEGYTARLRLPGERPLQAWLKIRYRPGFSCEHVVPAVVARPEVRLCHSLAGPVDLLVLASVGSLDELAAFREQVAGAPGVAEVETAPVLTDHGSMIADPAPDRRAQRPGRSAALSAGQPRAGSGPVVER